MDFGAFVALACVAIACITLLRRALGSLRNGGCGGCGTCSGNGDREPARLIQLERRGGAKGKTEDR